MSNENTTLTLTAASSIFIEGDIICTRYVNNGFWKMLLYWIIRKDLDRGDFHTVTKIINETTLEVES